MTEIIFEVLDDPAGGYTASALGLPIHTQGQSLDDLKEQVRDAIDCYYDDATARPAVVRLHFVRDEVMAL
jgi:hypothetical protein